MKLAWNLIIQNFILISQGQVSNNSLCIMSSGSDSSSRPTSINSLRPSDIIWQHRSGSTLAQVMVCCLTAPSHYPIQCRPLISKVLWHSPESNFKASARLQFWVINFEFILLKSLPHLPGANGLNCWWVAMVLYSVTSRLCWRWCMAISNSPSLGEEEGVF